MPTLLPIFTRRACGVVRTYAANPQQALALHELTGTNTLSATQLRALAQLGFTLSTVADPKSPSGDYGRVDVSTLTLPPTL